MAFNQVVCGPDCSLREIPRHSNSQQGTGDSGENGMNDAFIWELNVSDVKRFSDAVGRAFNIPQDVCDTLYPSLKVVYR